MEIKKKKTSFVETATLFACGGISSKSLLGTLAPGEIPMHRRSPILSQRRRESEGVFVEEVAM